MDGLIGQSAGAGDDANFARKVNVTGHDTDFAFARFDDTWAVGSNQSGGRL